MSVAVPVSPGAAEPPPRQEHCQRPHKLHGLRVRSIKLKARSTSWMHAVHHRATSTASSCTPTPVSRAVVVHGCGTRFVRRQSDTTSTLRNNWLALRHNRRKPVCYLVLRNPVAAAERRTLKSQSLVRSDRNISTYADAHRISNK